MAIKIVNADVIEWAKSYKGPQFHALFSDVPYELNFMGKLWDSSGIAFNPDTWRVLAEHLLPGAFLFVFAGTLNDDLISVAMRQAGLRKFHKALAWGFGSGFPKASRIDTTIDRAAGAKRKTAGERIYADGHIQRSNAPRFNGTDYNNGKTYFEKSRRMETAPATPLAKTWTGHRYGLQSLKPAVETILIFQKPYVGKPVESITKTGAGALNVDGSRIKTNGRPLREKLSDLPSNGIYGEGLNGSRAISKTLHGRWPANLLLVHHHDCNGTCSPACAIRLLDEQSGITSTTGKRSSKSRSAVVENTNFLINNHCSKEYPGDSGSASRFFFNADWNYEAAEKIENASGVRYQAKASRRERDVGLDEFESKVRRITEGHGRGEVNTSKGDGTGIRENRPCKNQHPTVKPLSLTKYLAALLSPPIEYAPRRILIPFAGVMSEAIGCMLAGWEEIIAIEKEKEYCEIGAARVKYWEKHKLPENKTKTIKPVENAILQESLFE